MGMKQAAGALLSSIQLDRTAKRGMSVQLYMSLRDIILKGGLRPGERLPATRVLAKEVGVSRTTVVDAIDRLVAEGMLVSQVGAGTFVSKDFEAAMPAQSSESGVQDLPRPRLSVSIRQADDGFAARRWLPHEARAFITALPALDAFPMAQWSRLAARQMRGGRGDVMGYGEPTGLEALRLAIAAHLSAFKGIQCGAHQIFVTSGAQQAFSLIGQLFLNPGDQVWMENPGAAGARNALLAEGGEMVPVPVDHEGLIVSQGLAKAPYFRMVFVTPSHQQPLGHVMSLPRRMELLKAAQEAQALIIEDDYDGEFHYGATPQPALYSNDTSGRVLYVGTFSKSLFPALRLGFVLVPDRMVPDFDRAFRLWASAPPTATQAIVADFIDEGHFAAHIRLMRRLYMARYDALVQEAKAFPDGFQLQKTASGFHTCAFLAPSIDPHAVVAQAAEKNVILAPIDRYCIEKTDLNGLVLGFGSATPEDIRYSCGVLRDLPALH